MTESTEFRLPERRWEDFPVGTFVRSSGLTVTEAHIVNFAGLSGDWLPPHTDATYAAGPGVVAHGTLILVLALGQTIRTGIYGDAVVDWLGLDEVRIHRKIRPGDTITTIAAVTEQFGTEDPDVGHVTLGLEVLDQDDRTALDCRSGFRMRRRQPAAPG